MIYVRNEKGPTEYKVIGGIYLDTYWGKKIIKDFKKTPHNWADIVDGLLNEFRFYDIARANNPSRYTTISSSNSAEFQLVKFDLKIPGLNKGASEGGYRAGLFIENLKEVTILFAGHHKHYGNHFKGNENDCFKFMLKDCYPELHDKLISI